MKHYIGKKVVICDRYKEFHHAIGRIVSIDTNYISVKMRFLDEQNRFHHSITKLFPKEKVRDFYNSYDKYYEDDNFLDHSIYQGIIHQINLQLGFNDDSLFTTYMNDRVAFIEKKSYTHKVTNKTIVFSVDVERFLSLYYRSFFRRKLNFICDINAPSATIYIKD